MAEIFVTPGVYTRENDFSYYVQSIGNSALALVGETKSGPAMVPTLVRSMTEFEAKFGGLDKDKILGYSAKSYFKYGNEAYIIRVLGDDLLREDHSTIPFMTSGGTCLAMLSAHADTTMVLTGATTTVAADELLTIEVVGVYTGSCSLTNKNSPYYIEKLFPRNSTVSTSACALQQVFPTACVGKSITTGTTVSDPLVAGSPLVVEGKSNAQSPMIVADNSGSGTGVGLFTIETIGDGNSANNDFKIMIENIDIVGETFDIVVRKYEDSNDNQIVLENYTMLSMDKTSPNYILKAIGDNRDEVEAEYGLISNYIYITIEDGDLSGLVPLGFNSIVVPASGASVDAQFPEFPMKTEAYSTSISVSKQCLGVDYSSIDPDQLMIGASSAWDLGNILGSVSDNYIKGFHLNSGANGSEYFTGFTGSTSYEVSEAKFVVPILGGNDGWANDDTERSSMLTGVESDMEIKQWKAALDLVNNTQEFDINLLAVPGVTINGTIGLYAITIVEERADCFYIGDMPSNVSDAKTAAGVVTGIDSNYAGTYWPYVKIKDTQNGIDILIPPTPQALEAMAYTDSVSYPWFAPAGMNRGLLTDVLRTQYKLKHEDMKILYTANINPIASIPGQGQAIWGNKTLQTRTTALDRINVRRMLLYVEKVIAGASRYLVFEQNDETTWDAFKSMVQPVLDTVRIERGLEDFRIKMDASTNTPEMIDRGQMVGEIHLIPTKSAEVILINFNIMNSGASFNEG